MADAWSLVRHALNLQNQESCLPSESCVIWLIAVLHKHLTHGMLLLTPGATEAVLEKHLTHRLPLLPSRSAFSSICGTILLAVILPVLRSRPSLSTTRGSSCCTQVPKLLFLLIS